MNITFRRAEASDEPFLRELYAVLKMEALQMQAWDIATQAAILELQYRAQRHSYEQNYPDAQQCIIELDGTPAGQTLVDRTEDRILFVDIAVHPELQRRGLARTALRRVMDEAHESGRSLRLNVFKDNFRSRALCDQMGFRVTAENDVQWELEFDPRSSPLTVSQAKTAS